MLLIDSRLLVSIVLSTVPNMRPSSSSNLEVLILEAVLEEIGRTLGFFAALFMLLRRRLLKPLESP